MAISVADVIIINQGFNKHKNKTTCWWELFNQIKKGFSKWVTLKYIKENNPVELAQYAVEKKIDQNTSFTWWVIFNLHLWRP